VRALLGSVADWALLVLGCVVWVLCAWFHGLAEHWGDVDCEECE
jgi:hypothetical protein